MARSLAALAAVLAAGLAGCGGSSPPQPAGTTTPRETNDRRPPLPPGWRRVVNVQAGYSLGIPPGWTARGGPGSTLVRSRDRALAVSVTADRSPQGRRLPPAGYALRTARALRGYGGLRVGGAGRVPGSHYPAAAVEARGTYRRTRVRQDIRVIALQRRGRVTFTLVAFRNATVAGGIYRAAVDEMVRTFRGQAPGL
jgi:hypothetical protein